MALAGVPGSAMLGVPLKSGEKVNFEGPLKQYIREGYGEDPKTYDDKIIKFSSLREEALSAPADDSGVLVLHRYFGQLDYLCMKFPIASGMVDIPFTWRNAFSEESVTLVSADFEKAAVLFNLAAVQASMAASVERTDPTSLKVACGYFQAAAGGFTYIKDNLHVSTSDLSAKSMTFLINLMLGQAQECVIERSVLDGGKASVLSKLCAECGHYYDNALVALNDLQGLAGKTEQYAAEMKVKSSFFKSLGYYYRAGQAKEANDMGLRVVLHREAARVAQATQKLLTRANLPKTTEAVKVLSTSLECRCKEAEQDNDNVYHQLIPDTVPDLQGVSIVRPTPLLVGPDAQDLVGPDIFNTLMPLSTTMAVSLYSEEKDKVWRRAREGADTATQEADRQLAKLNLPAALHNGAIGGGVDLSELEEVRGEVERRGGMPSILEKIQAMQGTVDSAKRVVEQVKSIQEAEGPKTTALQESESGSTTEMYAKLAQETDTCVAAFNQGYESHQRLSDAINSISDDVTALLSPDWKDALPPLPPEDTDARSLLELCLDGLTDLLRERQELLDQLRDMISRDDVSSRLLYNSVHNNDNKEAEAQIMKEALAKYDDILNALKTNMDSQPDAIRNMTDAYADYAQSKVGGERADRVRRLQLSAQTYLQMDDKIGDAERFWGNMGRMCQGLEVGWADVQAAREREERLIQPKNPPPRPYTSKPKPSDTPSSPTPPTGSTPEVPPYEETHEPPQDTEVSDIEPPHHLEEREIPTEEHPNFEHDPENPPSTESSGHQPEAQSPAPAFSSSTDAENTSETPMAPPESPPQTPPSPTSPPPADQEDVSSHPDENSPPSNQNENVQSKEQASPSNYEVTPPSESHEVHENHENSEEVSPPPPSVGLSSRPESESAPAQPPGGVPPPRPPAMKPPVFQSEVPKPPPAAEEILLPKPANPPMPSTIVMTPTPVAPDSSRNSAGSKLAHKMSAAEAEEFIRSSTAPLPPVNSDLDSLLARVRPPSSDSPTSFPADAPPQEQASPPPHHFNTSAAVPPPSPPPFQLPTSQSTPPPTTRPPPLPLSPGAQSTPPHAPHPFVPEEQTPSSPQPIASFGFGLGAAPPMSPPPVNMGTFNTRAPPPPQPDLLSLRPIGSLPEAAAPATTTIPSSPPITPTDPALLVAHLRSMLAQQQQQQQQQTQQQQQQQQQQQTRSTLTPQQQQLLAHLQTLTGRQPTGLQVNTPPNVGGVGGVGVGASTQTQQQAIQALLMQRQAQAQAGHVLPTPPAPGTMDDLVHRLQRLKAATTAPPATGMPVAPHLPTQPTTPYGTDPYMGMGGTQVPQRPLPPSRPTSAKPGAPSGGPALPPKPGQLHRPAPAIPSHLGPSSNFGSSHGSTIGPNVPGSTLAMGYVGQVAHSATIQSLRAAQTGAPQQPIGGQIYYQQPIMLQQQQQPGPMGYQHVSQQPMGIQQMRQQPIAMQQLGNQPIITQQPQVTTGYATTQEVGSYGLVPQMLPAQTQMLPQPQPQTLPQQPQMLSHPQPQMLPHPAQMLPQPQPQMLPQQPQPLSAAMNAAQQQMLLQQGVIMGQMQLPGGAAGILPQTTTHTGVLPQTTSQAQTQAGLNIAQQQMMLQQALIMGQMQLPGGAGLTQAHVQQQHQHHQQQQQQQQNQYMNQQYYQYGQ